MLKKIPLHQITRNPDQPRQTFDPTALRDLADSIDQNGLAQPITVRPIPEDAEGHRYMIIMGERRFRAHQLLQADGKLDSILAHVRSMDESEMHILAILENLQRSEVSPLEEGIAFQRMIDEFGFTIPELAKRLGISQHWRITERVQLLGLTEDNRQLLKVGVITATQAFHMAKLSPAGQQKFLELVKQGLASTNPSAMAAADAIAQKEAQSSMFGDEPAPKPRASLKTTEDQIDRIGLAVSALWTKDGFQIPANIDPAEAQRCAEKLRMLRANLGQIERILGKAASAEAAVA